MKTIKPQKLQKGDTIGLVSPAGSISKLHAENIERYLNSIGYKLKVAPNAFNVFSHMAGSAQERANDINLMFADPDVRAICSSTGGGGSSQVIPLLDFENIKKNPKIFLGLSNPSGILNAVYKMTGVVTFHGPNGVTFGLSCGMSPFISRAFFKVVSEDKPAGTIEMLDKWDWLKAGKASGCLIGGSLNSVEDLLGTPYEPEWEGAIWFWETFNMDYSKIDATLSHYRLAGVFGKISGMIIGKPEGCSKGKKVESLDYYDMVHYLTNEFDFPIVANVDIGHTPEKVTMPIGCHVTLDSSSNKISIDESAVI